MTDTTASGPVDVAVIKVAALGDVVRTTSILPGLRRRHPDMRLVWITSRQAIDLIRHHPDVHEAVAIEDLAAGGLGDRSFAWVISLDDEVESCRLTSTIAAARISGGYLGPDGCRRYTADTEPWFGMGRLRPQARGGLRRANELKRENKLSHPAILYKMLGLPGPIAGPVVVIPGDKSARPREWWRGHGLHTSPAVVGVNTGAGGRWRFKKWGEEQTVELVRALHDQLGVAVVLLGGPAERERNARILRAAARPRTFVAPADWSLLEFADVLRRCHVVVTSDSLALHLALACRVPAVAFFGPTSAAEIEMFGLGEKIETPLPCRCCYLTNCEVTPNCMDTISTRVMLDAVRRWLPRRGR
ncbi:MAG: glycosyltransferase family 9 protein [Acidobacteriota bacterium]|nr:glycosyltransferase family 9 protein [Acidobacteriota bacterium]